MTARPAPMQRGSEFAMYMDDDWAWKRQWLLTNSAYAAGTVKAEYGEF